MYFSKILARAADYLGLEDDARLFENQHQKMMDTLLKLHWDINSMSFCDITFNESGDMEHVVHKGYISILPLALEILPKESIQVGLVLDMIHNSKQLWSPYGICSLSKQDVYFGEGENYWRGPIWMNINYLLLRGLHKTYMKPGPFQAKATLIYTELRSNLINNVYEQYEATGFVWEQYSCLDGKGSRSHPFTGWTSLLVLIMSETYY
jgi:mannosyl-oligosaccharide glucosidase